MKNAKEDSGFRAAAYCRLSREDGDRPESDSIINQQRLIEDFCSRSGNIHIVRRYADDGYTGTNFNRPQFRQMLEDIKSGAINCVVVKDLSRFGRDYIGMGFYLERAFPEWGVRFIAINDNVDSLRGSYDMMLPLKNVFNSQYAKDISEKVRSSIRVRQQRGEFVGAFTSYGYLRDPDNHSHLVIDPVAAQTVKRIFDMAENGMGQITIAKTLNAEGIPSPSEYKRLMGSRYHNCNRLEGTTYWTYATIHRLLKNQMYRGAMVQGKTPRPSMHAKAKTVDKSDWSVVENTHEAIISQEQWDIVQAQVDKNNRPLDFSGNVSIFAGILKCGDCGRAMSKTVSGGCIHYTCGSYRRYGAAVCSSHCIRHDELKCIILQDLNHIIASVGDLQRIAAQSRKDKMAQTNTAAEVNRLQAALERVRRMKKGAYEDYREELLSKEEFLRYKADYDRQEQTLTRQLEETQVAKPQEILDELWVEELVRLGYLTDLDRQTVIQTVKEIRIFEGKHIEITYNFSEKLRLLLEEPADTLP